ncbi:MAG: TetR/AcrR family transcriptional regulator [Polyangiales bacterium]
MTIERRARRTQAERRETTRDKVERAAMSAVATRGFEGATIDVIARESGMSRGAVAVHFPAKEELWPVVVDRACRALEKDVAVAFEQSAGVGMNRVRAALNALLAARASDGVEQACWPELVRRAARDHAMRERLSPALTRVEAALGAQAQSLGEAAGLALKLPPAQAGRVILAVISALSERARLDLAPADDARADSALLAQVAGSLFSV